MVIQPRIVGGEQDLHPVLFIAAVIAGGHIMGVMGMIIAVPVVTIMQDSIGLLLERGRRFSATASTLTPRVQIQPYVC